MTTNEQSENGAVKPKLGKKSKLTKILPTDRISFPKQVEILRAFAVAAEHSPGEGITNEAAGKIVTMAPATLIQTNAFFCDIGLLTRSGQGFTVAKEVSDFQKACGWDQQTAGQKLSPILARSWFAQVIMPRLKMREIEESKAIQAIAEDCSAGKEHEERIRMLLEYLVTAEIIIREDGKIKLLSTSHSVSAALPTTPQLAVVTSSAPAVQPAYSDKGAGQAMPSEILPLDPEGKRYVSLTAPRLITKAEKEHIKTWLANALDFKFFVSDEEKPTS
jgi:hypothetical protein